MGIRLRGVIRAVGRSGSLTVVVGLAALPGIARADEMVQARVYGFLNAQIERPWASGGATPYDARFRVTDGGSRIGFAGAVIFTPEMSGLWQLEGALNGFEQGGTTDLGDHTNIVSRNSFVGFEHRRFGRVVAGNNDSAYRRLIGSGGDLGGDLGLTVLGLDFWNNTNAQLSGSLTSIFGRGEERYHNSVHYVSPAWRLGLTANFVQVAASYGFDEVLQLAGRRDRFSAAALYRIKGFSLGAAFDRQANTGVNVDTLQRGLGLSVDAENGVATYYYEAIASYHFQSGTYVGVGFERSNYGFFVLVPPTATMFYPTFTVGVMHQSGGMASLAQEIRKLTLMASAGLLWDLENTIAGSPSDYRAMQYSLGGKYTFSAHFAAYVYFTAIHNGARQDVNLGAPIFSNNLGTPQAYLAPGDNPRSAGLGAVVRF
jgi:predicted porin